MQISAVGNSAYAGSPAVAASTSVKQAAAKGGTPTSSGSASSSSTSSVYDKADANQDGVVSPAEELAYNLKHPSEAATKAAVGALLDRIG
jgi:hypothetical protein